MNILLCFDHESYIIVIPDGYISDVNAVHKDFFEWLYSQKENICSAQGILGITYDAYDFLRYVNEVLLIDKSECAYLKKYSPQIKIKKRLVF